MPAVIERLRAAVAAHRGRRRRRRGHAGGRDARGRLSDVRILVAMSGGVDSSVAAALLHEQGHEVVGVWMRLHDVADTYSEFRKSCCSADAADDARRVAAQARHPVLRHEPRAGVRGRGHRAVHRRLPRRSDAKPVRRLQQLREVRRAAGQGPPPVRVRGRRDRPLRAPRGRRHRRRAAGDAGPRRGRGQGPDLLPVRPPPGPAVAQPVPAGRPDQARGPRDRPRAGPGDGRQAREPGDLLRARRRLPRRAAIPRRLDARARARSSTPTAAASASTPGPPGSPWASGRA